MKKYLVLAAGCAVLLSGCAVMDGQPAAMPTNMPDGPGTYRFISTTPLGSHWPDEVAEYTGQWVANRPKGQGRAVTSIGLSCKGEFGLAAPSKNEITNDRNAIFGKGDVYQGTQLIYSGYFVNWVTQGRACTQMGEGTRILNGWKVTGTFFYSTYMRSGPCQIEKSGGEVFSGNCSPPPGVELRSDGVFLWNSEVVANQFLLAAGLGVFTDAAGTRYEGDIKRGAVLNGVYTVTRKKQAPTLARLNNGKIVAEHPTPDVIAQKGKACGPGDWRLMKGNCAGKKWSGQIDAYTLNGRMRLQAEISNGKQTADATFSSLDHHSVVRGKLQMPTADDISFIKGQVLSGDTVTYDGDMTGLLPDGKGICLFDGARESCEFVKGERIDSLHKMRQENGKLITSLEKQKKEAARETALRVAAAQQQTTADESGGFQWGKLVALGAGATIGKVGKLPQEVQAKVFTGILKDSLAGQEGIANTSGALTPTTSAPSSGSRTTTSPATAATATRSDELWHDGYSNRVIATGVLKDYPNHERNIPGDVVASRVGSRAAAQSVWTSQGGTITEYVGCGGCGIGSTIRVTVKFSDVMDYHVFTRDR